MPTCNTTVTTPTGVFTYFSKKVTLCEAKARCAKIRQILAPVLNFRDLDALRSIADYDNPDCEFHSSGIYSYHTGLDIDTCGKKHFLKFSNGVVYDEAEHGKLYKWVDKNSRKRLIASYMPDYRNLFIIEYGRWNRKKRYICLKPSSTSANAASLVEKESESNSSFNVLILVGALIVALIALIASLVFYTRSKKKDMEIVQLKSKVDYHKNENDALLNEKKNVM